MATATRRHPDVTVLYPIPYKVYARLARDGDNRHVRMAYHDGTLEIVSFILLEHEDNSRRLSLVVTTVADELGWDFQGSGGTTFHREGDGPYKGKGKEPDQGFYIASLPRLPVDRNPDLNLGDPPPDIWIEVDHRVSSRGRLPVYAAMGVPEVWRYRTGRKTFKLLRLVGDAYAPAERSLALPILTPALILEALTLGEGLPESQFARRLRVWARRLVGHQANP